MKAFANQVKYNTGVHNLPTIMPNNNEGVWTNTPQTVNHLRIKNGYSSMTLMIAIKGITKDNYSIKIIGNLLVFIVEHKKELIRTSLCGNTALAGGGEKYSYSVFERSDIFLPGEEIKTLKSVHFEKGGMLKVRINLLPDNQKIT